MDETLAGIYKEYVRMQSALDTAREQVRSADHVLITVRETLRTPEGKSLSLWAAELISKYDELLKQSFLTKELARKAETERDKVSGQLNSIGWMSEQGLKYAEEILVAIETGKTSDFYSC